MKLAFVAVAILGIIVVVGRIGFAGPQVVAAPLKGYRMPPFTLTEYPNGQTLDTKAFSGKPEFINFWASWCPPCNAETPGIVEAYRKYGRTVTFVSVNVTSQDSLAGMRKFVSRYGIPFPVALDKKGDVMQLYRVLSFPTSFFVNRQGTIVDIADGQLSANELNAELQKISD